MCLSLTLRYTHNYAQLSLSSSHELYVNPRYFRIICTDEAVGFFVESKVIDWSLGGRMNHKEVKYRGGKKDG